MRLLRDFVPRNDTVLKFTFDEIAQPVPSRSCLSLRTTEGGVAISISINLGIMLLAMTDYKFYFCLLFFFQCCGNIMSTKSHSAIFFLRLWQHCDHRIPWSLKLQLLLCVFLQNVEYSLNHILDLDYQD